MAHRKPVILRAKVLLQVDLEGHLAWLRSARSKPQVVGERIGLARRLHRSLKHYGFVLVSWKGDGGLYAADPGAGDGNFDFAVTGAHRAAEVFARWRAEKPSRARLRLRISVHYAPKVYVHREPDYWTSDDLNVFIKYEREIGISGTVAVTDDVYSDLSETRQKMFGFSRALSLGAIPGEDLIRRVHYSSIDTKVLFNRGGKLGLFEWLRERIPFVLTQNIALGPRSNIRAAIGDAFFLFAAPYPESPLSIDLVPVESGGEPVLEDTARQQWHSAAQQLAEASRREGREDGVKVSPLRVTRPLTDIPYARLEWRTELWSRARAFHRLLEADSNLWTRIAANAADIQETGLSWPGILCCHFIVRTADPETKQPQILLSQRQIKGPADTYHEGAWSASFEEQLRPGESITSCISRGLAEELLGQQGSLGVSSRVLAGILEGRILNLSLIVLVDVPLGFEGLASRWRTAVDKDENRQLAVIPLEQAVLAEIAKTAKLSTVVQDMIRPGDPQIFGSTKLWQLHPTSLARIAIALWVQDTGG